MEKTFADFYDQMMEYVDYDLWGKYIDDKLKLYIEEKNILEIGCGTGEISHRLTKLNYKVSAIEISPEMIEISSRKYDDFNVKQLDMRELCDENKYDAIICVFDALNYLQSLDDLKKVFNNIKRALKKDGVFLFDVLNRKMIDSMFGGEVFADDRENISIIWKHSYDEKKDLDKIETSFFVKENENNYKRYDEVFYKKIYNGRKILELIEELDFELVLKEVNTEIAGPRMVYLIKKR